MKNQYCYDPADWERGTVVSDALLGPSGNRDLCNVIWDSGKHCTEKIENIVLSEEVNTNPPKW